VRISSDQQQAMSILSKITSRILSTPRRWVAMTRERAALERQWRSFGNKRRTPRLESNIIVSITSYPARYRILPLTLKTLLMQSHADYRLILWIAHDDYKALPRSVRRLTRAGLEIMTCADLRSYKKLIPAMMQFPDHIIVTADDDVCYWPTWLAELVSEYSPGKNEVLCHRMHQIRMKADGTPMPYREWVFESDSLQPHSLNFATGAGGILYPPHTFPKEAFDERQMFSQCATADDIWFHWMARRNGMMVRKVPSTSALRLWSGSQDTALWQLNVWGHENDRLIENMTKAYGFREWGTATTSSAPFSAVRS